MNASAPDTSAWLHDAIEHHRAGRLDEARMGYERILAVDPTQFDALHLSGLIARQQGNVELAIQLIGKATQFHPSAYPAFDSLGLAFQDAGNNDRAEASFRTAIALRPDFAPAHENLGRLLYARGRMEEAATAFASVARLLPESAAARNNLGTLLASIRRHTEARRCYERALELDPAFADASLNLAELLMLLGDLEAAERRYLAAIAAVPGNATLHYRLGHCLYKQGRRVDSQTAFKRALALDGDCVEARWGLTMSELPMAYGPGEAPGDFRDRFAGSLDQLDRWFDREREELGHRAVGNQQPFYLAFHAVDNRELLTRYGDLCARLMARWRSSAAIPSRERPGDRRLRIGLVSGFFFDQSVWTAIVRGWCSKLDRDRFELHLIYTGTIADAETEIARSHAASFHSGLSSLADWARAVDEQHLDVIVYPEIGMDRMTVKLASMRLAPVQVAGWGHPETTGLPTIDYYISAAAFEPPDGARNYREELVALPGLGVYYEPLEPGRSVVDWGALGVDASVPRLVCAATPYKYLPQNDWVLVEIARRLPQCQFLFFADAVPRLTQQLAARLAGEFLRAGLQASRFLRFLPRQTRAGFFALMRQSDVYLDTLDFSGFNTAMQAVESGLPVVTREARFMRGRLAGGVLKQLRLDELVAADDLQYIELAVRLCSDKAYNGRIREQMEARRGTLFRDLAPIRALESFFERVAGQR